MEWLLYILRTWKRNDNPAMVLEQDVIVLMLKRILDAFRTGKQAFAAIHVSNCYAGND